MPLSLCLPHDSSNRFQDIAVFAQHNRPSDGQTVFGRLGSLGSPTLSSRDSRNHRVDRSFRNELEHPFRWGPRSFPHTLSEGFQLQEHVLQKDKSRSRVELRGRSEREG